MTEPDGDRGRGMLTPSDRAYLRASEEERQDNYSRQARHERRRAIQERVENGLLDFQVLLEHLDAEERAKIFSVNECMTEERPLPVDVVDNALAFLFLGLTDGRSESGPEKENNGHHFPAFETPLRMGMGRGYRERGLLLEDITFEISSREVPDLKAVQTIVDENGYLPPGMAATIVASGVIDEDDLREFLREQLEELGTGDK